MRSYLQNQFTRRSTRIGQTIHWTSHSDWRAGLAVLAKVGSFGDESAHRTGSGNSPSISVVV